MHTNEELAAAVQAGNRDAINQLWVQCYGFIRQHAIRWARAWIERSDFDADDLIQCGYIALIHAARGYQAERGSSFLGYLLYHLKTEFARCAGCQTKAQAAAPLNHAISLDAPVYIDDERCTTIGDTIPYVETGFEVVEDSIYREQVAGSVRSAVADLPELQRMAVEAYYLDGKTYSETGNALGISRKRAEAITKDGLKNLRTGSHAPTLSELLWSNSSFYKHTGLNTWKETGCSVQEWSLLWNEREIRRYNLTDTKGAKIRYCIEVLGMEKESAERLFPV